MSTLRIINIAFAVDADDFSEDKQLIRHETNISPIKIGSLKHI